MSFRSQFWTYLLVTVVALLIWVWAAGETLDKTRTSIPVRFEPPPSGGWVISPPDVTVTVELEGSRFALQRARDLEAIRLVLGEELPSQPGEPNVDLVEALESHEPLRDTGVRVLSADPSSMVLRIDSLVTITAPIQPILPLLETEGEIKVEPAQVQVTMPSRLVAGDPVVEAFVEPARLRRLEPGGAYTLQASLRLTGVPPGDRSVRFDPPTADVSFQVRSLIEETTLERVRVHVAGPAEDHDEYVVQIEEDDVWIRNVTIKADGELIRQIAQGDVKVYALVHVSLSDKENRVERKPVTCFLAVWPDGRGTIVEAETDGSQRRPEVRLNITERN